MYHSTRHCQGLDNSSLVIVRVLELIANHHRELEGQQGTNGCCFLQQVGSARCQKVKTKDALLAGHPFSFGIPAVVETSLPETFLSGHYELTPVSGKQASVGFEELNAKCVIRLDADERALVAFQEILAFLEYLLYRGARTTQEQNLLARLQ
jgi:hypothetical protein